MRSRIQAGKQKALGLNPITYGTQSIEENPLSTKKSSSQNKKYSSFRSSPFSPDKSILVNRLAYKLLSQNNSRYNTQRSSGGVDKIPSINSRHTSTAAAGAYLAPLSTLGSHRTAAKEDSKIVPDSTRKRNHYLKELHVSNVKDILSKCS